MGGTRRIELLDVPYGRAAGSRLHDRLRHGESGGCRAREQPGGNVFDGRFGAEAVRGGGGLRRRRLPAIPGRRHAHPEEDRAGTGRHFGANDAEGLGKVFSDLPKEVTRQKRPTEVTSILAALGALLAAAAVAASMRWSSYP
jgi:hypothetical protein